MELFQHIGWIEWIGVITGIIYVIFAAKGKWWCWPVGLIWVLCTFFLSVQGKLYSDAALQVIYFGLTLFGWYNWIINKHRSDLDKPIETTTSKEWLYGGIVLLTVTALQFYLLTQFSDSDVPFLDSLTTSLSLVATWLLAKKKIESWWVWIVVNPIYIWLYHFKGYDLYAWLAVFFTVMSIVGLIQWQKLLKAQNVSR